MVVVDANVLLYAADLSSAHHERAHEWLERSLGGREAVGFTWVVLLAFLRIGTSRALLPNPLGTDEAFEQIEAWLGAPAAVVIEPSSRHLHLFRGLLAEAGTAGNLTNDAHLAALAIEHDADLVSFDRDFGRFAGLRHRVPAEPG